MLCLNKVNLQSNSELHLSYRISSSGFFANVYTTETYSGQYSLLFAIVNVLQIIGSSGGGGGGGGR
jgi:hypothetical protein